jgi:hypothetical protein
MVALGDEVIVSGGVKHTRGVPVSLPAGMQWQPVKHETTLELDKTTTKNDKTDKTDQTHKTDTTDTADKDERKPDRRHPSKQKSEAGGDAPTAKAPPPDRDAVRLGDARDTEKPAKKHGKPAHDESGRDDDNAREEDDAQDPEGAANGAPPVATSISGSAESETVSIHSLSPEGHYLRIEASLAGGVAVVDGSGSFVTIGHLGLERSIGSSSLMLGVDASLWVIPGSDVEGTLLGTVTRYGNGRFELGAGVDLHLGSDAGVGPAFDLLIRTRLPVQPLWLYLRYDGSLLFHDGVRDGQNTGTVGIEAHF